MFDNLKLRNRMLLGYSVPIFLFIGLAIPTLFAISSGITKKISQAVSAIATSSNQIASTIEEHERISTQQATSVNETTTTMDELGASSQQSADQAESANFFEYKTASDRNSTSSPCYE